MHGQKTPKAVELSDVVSGRASGRVNDDEITLFKSVGTGVQDLVVAARLLELWWSRLVFSSSPISRGWGPSPVM
jgi:ornithine cyclodeaminase/alanine dehydrogenase-like protein (mu-crystallin family)